MCGISGWIDWEADLTREADILQAMAETLAGRGPDAAGLWLSRSAGLAHRRLIVIDPEGGSQPMVRQRGNETFVLVYNGELYNTEELRQELVARGYNFLGHSDTEVLLTAYMEWGPAAVERLNGIFAFAVWEESGQRLFLARDPLGVKPLFYFHRGNSFLFASEIKALLAHPAVKPEIGAEGLAEVFGLGPARTPGGGVFRGVAELKPGHYLVVERRGVHSQRYWGLDSHPHEDDLEATAATVRELVQDAVKRQLVADVPLCVLLSGGLDSSAVAAVAAGAFQQQGLRLATFSVDYHDNDRYFTPSDFQPNADGPWIEMISRHLDTDHHAVALDTPELVTALRAAMRARDLPGMADVDSSLYLFCRQVKEGATVALVGEAADEVFGGYPWFRRADAFNADTFPWALSTHLREQVLSPELTSYVRPREYVADRYQQALAEVPRLPGEEARAARLREISYLSLTRFLPVLLERMDRMSMAVGLEIRVPYCDPHLVQYVWNVPWEIKTSGGMVKGLLRQALHGLLPEPVLYRPKSPYPKTHNPSFTTAVRQGMAQILADPTSPLLPLINTEFIRHLAGSDLQDISLPWFGQLMTGPQLFAYLMQMDAWLRQYRISIC
ncbi:MAG: asparagine synthase (glutamine-hydrolyzing) [Clostridia bacterium]|nr:MAG: asparagine synthase (glutamine-hydrolyzing) [Clostridia bacterium]